MRTAAVDVAVRVGQNRRRQPLQFADGARIHVAIDAEIDPEAEVEHPLFLGLLRRGVRGGQQRGSKHHRFDIKAFANIHCEPSPSGCERYMGDADASGMVESRDGTTAAYTATTTRTAYRTKVISPAFAPPCIECSREETPRCGGPSWRFRGRSTGSVYSPR